MTTNLKAEQPTTTMVMLPESVWQEVTNIQKKMLFLLQKKEEDPEWIESPKARKMLGVCAKTWQDYRDKRVIPFSQFGRKIYIKKADLDTFMEQHYISKK